MSEMNVYFIIEAEDKKEAVYEIENWLEDYMDRCSFYRWYKISDAGVKRISKFKPGYFESLLRKCEKSAEGYRDEINKYRTQNDPWNEGCAHKSLSNILMRAFNKNMPYWNLTTDSWDLPLNQNDWAVLVTLYYEE